MPNTKHFLLIPVGSHGDVNPFIGLGAVLKQRGHRVTVVTNGYFEDMVRREGLDFVELGTRDEFLRMVNRPELWDPISAFFFVFREGVLPSLRPLYKIIQDHVIPGETVVVGSVLAVGARIAYDKMHFPFASIHLQPAVFRSAEHPPLLPGLHFLQRLPPWLVKIVFRMGDWIVDRVMAPEVNRFRAELGLPPARRLIDVWWHSPQKIIGLFPSWFAAPAADWPPHAQLTGFPLYDGASVETIPGELEDFLAAGPPPVIFTPGSAMSQGESFFRESVAACETLGCRGILLTKFPASVPKRLPSTVKCFGYIPFSQILPRAAAFVHHGGIGSTSQALAAGVPQLVMPLAHDQPDNASRAKNLGTALVISPGEYRADRVAPLLKALLNDPSYKTRCAAVRRLFSGSPLEETARLLEVI